MLSTGDIKELLGGIVVSGKFVENVLKVKAKQRAKKGVYWTEADWPLIRDALAKYVKSLPDEPVIDDGL